MITQFDNWRRLEHPLLVDDQLTMLQRINVALDQQQITAALHGQEPLARHIDTMGLGEVLDRSTGGSLELDNSVAVVGRLGVDDDLELHRLGVHDALEGWEVEPEVVGVEDFEFADRLEVLNVL